MSVFQRESADEKEKRKSLHNSVWLSTQRKGFAPIPMNNEKTEKHRSATKASEPEDLWNEMNHITNKNNED